MQDAHPPAQEQEEGHQQLDEVVDQGLEAVEPPRRAVHEVRDGAGHRLRLECERKKGINPLLNLSGRATTKFWPHSLLLSPGLPSGEPSFTSGNSFLCRENSFKFFSCTFKQIHLLKTKSFNFLFLSSRPNPILN